MSERALTVAEVADRLGVTTTLVRRWIHNGELRAIDVSGSPGGKRPTWRITLEAIHAFELRRSFTPPPPPTRRRKQQPEVIRFY